MSRPRKARDKENFKEDVRAWAARLKVEPARIRVQKMRHKWASCSPGKWISFSEDLLAEPGGFRRYAIVHELLHLRVPNHGRLFKSLMSVYVPDWENWETRASRDL
ncbi:MAG TPA: M48 family metallopeptidase [bacterium]|nr:M48 family metallopeptidase [bacterium]HPQ71987.1 M48 family metallopeptidase [bacterium]